MDRTFRTLFAVLIIAIGISGIVAGISIYTDLQYKNTFESSYSYECSIKTDSVLENVKIYVPLPSGPTGNSVIGLEAGKKTVNRLPEDWKTEILGSDNWLMLEIRADRIEPMTDGEDIALSVTSESRDEIDTKNPAKFAEVLRPVKNPERIACMPERDRNSQCYMYTGQVFAYYLTEDNATVRITVSLTGENSWKIFERESNMFSDVQFVTIIGDGKGWYETEGIINAAIGTYR